MYNWDCISLFTVKPGPKLCVWGAKSRGKVYAGGGPSKIPACAPVVVYKPKPNDWCWTIWEAIKIKT